MTEKLISVIVPVYKAEKYLNQCVESILNQTYRNLEVILVDDGSPDECPEICDAWAKKDNRVKVIHQLNSGGGKARNVALACAKGDYITFVDSDDYISVDMFQTLSKYFDEEIDIVECNYTNTDNDCAEFDDLNLPIQIEEYSSFEAMKKNIEDHIFRQLIWNKMYRREVIGQVRFPEGKKIDDEFWTYQVIGNAKKLRRIDKAFYAYRQQPNSVMHLLDTKKRFQAIEAKCNRHEYIKEQMPELIEDSLVNIWFTCMYQGQLILRAEGTRESTEFIEYLRNILRKYPIDKLSTNISMSHKIWLQMAQKSFKITCKIRNCLKIGI